jgi:phosphoadenosine phosphosulfate reductase
MAAIAPSFLLTALNRQFERTTPKAILRWAAQTYGAELAVVTSLQPAGIAALHMLSELRDELPAFPRVLTIDTGLLFPETYALIETVERHLGLTIDRVKPAQTVAQQNEAHGDALWSSNPDACCNLRKVVPLAAALDGCSAWVAGLRRDQPGRAATPILGYDKKHRKLKLSPFANWDESTLSVYIQMNDLPVNPLHARGYASIGCVTCTQPASGGLNSRVGRWAGHQKVECGIHLQP